MTHLKSGDLVLAHCIIGAQKEETENKGHFLHEDGDMLVCEFVSNQRRTLDRSKVKRYQLIDHDAMLAECRTMFPQVVASVKDACSKLLGAGDYMPINQDPEELTMSLLDGTVVIEPAPFRVNTIAGIRERAGFEISYFKHHMATRHEPEDVEQCPIKVLSGDLQIAQAIVELLFRMKCDPYFEHISECRIEEEWAASEM